MLSGFPLREWDLQHLAGVPVEDDGSFADVDLAAPVQLVLFACEAGGDEHEPAIVRKVVQPVKGYIAGSGNR
jgi:hypothetical protein